MTAALEGGEWSAARPGRTLPLRKTRYPFYRRLGGPPRPVWKGGKSRPALSSVAIPTELPGHHLRSTYYHMISIDHKLKLVLSETFVLLRLSILIWLKLLATAVRLHYSLLYPRKRPGSHFTGGWVGPRAGLDGRKISSPP